MLTYHCDLLYTEFPYRTFIFLLKFVKIRYEMTTALCLISRCRRYGASKEAEWRI